MKKLVLFALLFLPFWANSQDDCKFNVTILQNPPSMIDLIRRNHYDEMAISQRPDVEAKEIVDTFEVYRYCTDNGISVIQAIRPHEKEDEFGFKTGYQVVFRNDNAPAELKELTIGDCVFFKIIPFFKANRMPSGLHRPIELNGVWVSVPQYASDNIYSVEPSSIYKLTSIDCDCDSTQNLISNPEESIKNN